MASLGERYAREREVSGHFTANPFFRSIGLRAVSHWPCSFECSESIKAANGLQQVFEQFGDPDPSLYGFLGGCSGSVGLMVGVAWNRGTQVTHSEAVLSDGRHRRTIHDQLVGTKWADGERTGPAISV